MEDNSDLIAVVECQLQRHELDNHSPRIVAFRQKIGARDGRNYKRWKELPVTALEKISGVLQNG